jgi:hypothetical protein
MPEMLRHEHISSNSCSWWQGFSLSCPKKGCAQTMAIKLGQSPQPDERFGFGESGGSRNSPFEAKQFFKGVGFMVKIYCFLYKKKIYKI